MNKKIYQAYKKKYSSLPNFEVLDHEFEISSIESELFVLRQIRKKAGERIEGFIKFIEEILQPEGASFSSMYECLCFDDTEKKAMLDIYKKMMILHRSLVSADIALDNKQDVEVIKLVTKEWPVLSKKLLPYVEKIKKHWHELRETKEILDYLQ